MRIRSATTSICWNFRRKSHDFYGMILSGPWLFPKQSRVAKTISRCALSDKEMLEAYNVFQVNTKIRRALWETVHDSVKRFSVIRCTIMCTVQHKYYYTSSQSQLFTLLKYKLNVERPKMRLVFSLKGSCATHLAQSSWRYTCNEYIYRN